MKAFDELIQYINRLSDHQKSAIDSSIFYIQEFKDSILDTIEDNRSFHLDKIQDLNLCQDDIQSFSYHISWVGTITGKMAAEVSLVDNQDHVIGWARSSCKNELLIGDSWNSDTKEEIEKTVLCRALNKSRAALKHTYIALNEELKLNPQLLDKADVSGCCSGASFPYEGATFNPGNVMDLLALVEDYQKAPVKLTLSA